MNNLEYLNQISQSTRPTKATNSISSSLPIKFILKIVGGAILVFIALLIIGNALGNAGGKVNDLTRQVYLRSTNLNTLIGGYRSSLKSSQLRSISTSLSGVLTGSSNQIASYLQSNSKEGSKDKEALSPKESTVAQETTHIEEINTILANARINGMLDRTYANQIQLQVSLLLSLCSELEARAKNEELLNIISTMISNLKTIEESLENYSNLGS